MKIFTTLALLAGVALFGWLLTETDLAAVADIVIRVGWAGAAAIVAVFAAGFGAEIVAWALIFPGRPLTAPWFGALWLVNMVGEAFNVVLPFGSLGGEPFKALLLKRHYRIPYPESSSTLFLMQTILAMAEAPFALIGVILAVRLPMLSPELKTIMVIAALVLTVLMALTLLALHKRWLGDFNREVEASRWGEKLSHVVAGMDEAEEQMFAFVRRNPMRFAASLGLFFLNWVAGAVEVWVIMILMGHPLSFGDCWIMEAAVVLVRSATFFIPANLGSFEAATVFVTVPFTGSADIGLALALIRRARELFWSALGLAIGGWYNLRQPADAA